MGSGIAGSSCLSACAGAGVDSDDVAPGKTGSIIAVDRSERAGEEAGKGKGTPRNTLIAADIIVGESGLPPELPA